MQIKFLAMHITNQQLCFNIYTGGHLQNIFMEHGKYDFNQYNLFLATATYMSVQLKTDFVVQGHN